MEKRTAALLIVFFTVFSAMAARMSITSYGIPHIYPINSSDKVTFDPTGLFVTITSQVNNKSVSTKYYLGYSNNVKFDTIGGPLTNFCINNADGTKEIIDFSSIDSLVITPQLDESGDDDEDGLTNLAELMIWGTDPQKKDTDGDGYDDKWELGKDPNVWSPVIANLPLFSVEMLTYPEIFLITESSTSQSIENTVSKGTSWGTTEGVTTTDSKSSSLSGMTSIEICNSSDAGYEIIPKFSYKFQVTVHQEFSYGTETTHSIETSRQVENQQSYEQATTRGEETGITYTGGKLSVYVRLTNSGSIGYELSNPVFTLYGISYVRGYPKESPLCDLTPASEAGQFSLAPGASKELQLKATGNLELDEVNKVLSYSLLKIGCTFPNVTYHLENDGSPVGLAKTMTDVMASTVQLIVDFDEAKKGQSNIDKKIATLTKFNPFATTPIERYGKVYLGEILKTAGLTYTFDTLGFIEINGLKRDKNNVWVTQIIHPQTTGGAAADTVEVRMGQSSGPDSVIIRTGDLVFVSYSGDDNRDSVSNAVAKMYGIYDADASSKQSHDFDNDGVSNYQEIYGWVASGSPDTIRTSPRDPDCDGDGIPDGEDPLPLSPRLAASSNVQSFSILDARDSIVETITFDASEDSKTLSKDVPCIPHFQVTVDTMPLWCKLTVNGDTLVLVYDTMVIVPGTDKQKSDTLYRFINNPTVNCNPIPLGNVKVKVITRPLDKSKTQVWTISGKSGLVNILGKPVVSSSPVATTTSGKWWQQLRVNIKCKQQYDSDPRATGYIVVRSTDPNKGFNVTGDTTSLVGRSHNSWVVSKIITGDDMKMDYQYDDSVLLSGTAYFYRVIPYFLDGTTYTYGASPASAISDMVRTWKIMVNPQYYGWWCHSEGDVGESAEFVWNASIKKIIPGDPTEYLIGSLGQKSKENVTDESEEVDAFGVVSEFKQDEKFICWYMLYEDDDGSANDVLWNENVLEIHVGSLVNAKDTISIGASGSLSASKIWDTGTPNSIPNVVNKNRVHFWEQRSNGTVVTLHYYIYWWFE